MTSVLVVSPTLPDANGASPDGAATAAASHARLLAERGFAVHVAQHPTNVRSDALIAHEAHTDPALVDWLRVRSSNAINVVHTPAHIEAHIDALQLLDRRGVRIAAVSPYASALLNRHGINASVIPAGLPQWMYDTDSTPGTTSPELDLLRQKAQDADLFIFNPVARPTEAKGVHVAIEAAALATHSGLRVFHWIGHTGVVDATAMIELARRADDTSHNLLETRFASLPSDDVFRAMRLLANSGSALMVSASRHEGFPLTVMMACLAGLPMVLSDINGHGPPEYVPATRFAVGDTDESGKAAQAMLNLHSDDTEKGRLIEAGRRRAEEFREDVLLDELLQLVDLSLPPQP